MKCLFFVLSAFCLISSSFAKELTSNQLDSLKITVSKIKRCPTYSINSERNNPYEETCVNRLVEVNVEVFKSFVPVNKDVIRDLNQIKKCPTYSLNSERNNPYEETCVNRLVENVVNDLEDMKHTNQR
jgi:hypothetical protein